MARFQVDVEKRLGTEYWTNVYQVEASDLGTASDAANYFAQGERVFHSDEVVFTQYRVRTAVEGDDLYVTVPLNVPGLLVHGSPHLPLFNVVRVDIGATQGRPSRKYYRTGLFASQVQGTDLADTYILTVQNGVIAMRDDVNGTGAIWTDVDGQALVGLPSVQKAVGMRQLRRGSKRRATPVLGPAE